MGLVKRLAKGWQDMLQQVLPWAAAHPKLFIFSCCFWLLLPVSLGAGLYFAVQVWLSLP